jgi:hypothetical protein
LGEHAIMPNGTAYDWAAGRIVIDVCLRKLMKYLIVTRMPRLFKRLEPERLNRLRIYIGMNGVQRILVPQNETDHAGLVAICLGLRLSANAKPPTPGDVAGRGG